MIFLYRASRAKRTHSSAAACWTQSTHHRGHGGTQELVLPPLAFDHPFDSVTQVEDVEIDQETYRYSAQTHVGQQLCLMNRVKGVDGFHFHYDSVFNDEVDAISDFELLTFVDHRLRYLGCDFKAAASQFLRQ